MNLKVGIKIQIKRNMCKNMTVTVGCERGWDFGLEILRIPQYYEKLGAGKHWRFR